MRGADDPACAEVRPERPSTRPAFSAQLSEFVFNPGHRGEMSRQGPVNRSCELVPACASREVDKRAQWIRGSDPFVYSGSGCAEVARAVHDDALEPWAAPVGDADFRHGRRVVGQVPEPGSRSVGGNGALASREAGTIEQLKRTGRRRDRAIDAPVQALATPSTQKAVDLVLRQPERGRLRSRD